MLECAMVLFFLIVLLGMLYLHRVRSVDGFVGSVAATVAQDVAQRCGVQFPAGCARSQKCFNGYCGSTEPPHIPPYSELSVVPSGDHY